MAGRAAITHYAWQGGVAVVFEAFMPRAAVFSAGGWEVGNPETVFTGGPPAEAEVARLSLREELVEQIAALQFSSAGLHTDFVHLDRYVARLQAEGAHAVVLVLGPGPAVLAITEGSLAVIEPSAAAATPDAVMKQARGWIVVVTGTLIVPVVYAEEAIPPDPQMPVIPEPLLQAPGVSEPVMPAETIAPPAAVDPAAFARFKADARYLLASDAGEKLPNEIAAHLAAVAGNGATSAMLRLLDGSRTLAQIALETGLAPRQIETVLETLVAHRLAFKYISRTRPPTRASTSR